MLFLLHLRKEKQGQIGERNKTIILLRVSMIAQPPEGASGQRNGSDGLYGSLFYSDRTNATK